MRVLMSADTVGGVWTYALELSRALAARGAEVTLATLGAPLSEEQRRAAEQAPLRALHDGGYALEWMPGSDADVEDSGRWLVELADSERADVVQLCSFAHGSQPWAAPAVVVGHSCVCSWWRAVHGREAPTEWERYRERSARGLAAADAVVAPSAAMLDELRRCYGVRGGDVIHNASSSPLAAPGPREPFVLAAGRLWDPAKNLASLAAAAEGLPWPVLAAGPLDGHRAPASVRALGRVSATELRALRERAAIFAAPARYEPFGLAALEAARSGCALVLGDISSLREVWGDAALYVDPDGPRELHAALAELIADERRRLELARRAHERAQRYRVAAMADAYLRLYERVREARAVPA